ncbi:hypothetical protein BS1321_07820 [Peribacillus simplex NBRC 15720 = DSM 1321]|uniref:Uncharacterized protein n=1 Tax=Peribacillus simplex NBRC 15720 = DSM 1321 TaxID=1349754 RepID=A0A223EF50_9BACI|nr:hypothetical protein BS1321_07820 [Peribacillus simplex NBRC 15720 = DSM 1321]CAH0142945.1 hypothetical protein SRABI84_00506 [Peribacillus simplex]
MSKHFNFLLLWVSQTWSTLFKYRIYFIQAFLVLFLMYLLLNEQEINTLKITLILITSLSFLKSAHRKKG